MLLNEITEIIGGLIAGAILLYATIKLNEKDDFSEDLK